MDIKLSRPLKYKNTDLETLTLELDALTGRDLIDAEAALKAAGVNVPAWEYSREYLLAVAAKSLHIPAEVLKDLPAADFTRLINEVLSFLAGAASLDSPETA